MRIAIVIVALALAAACAPGALADGAAPADWRGAPGATSAQSPGRPTREADLPPLVSLAAGGTPVAGWLGSYCWDATCVDVARVPAKSGLPSVEASTGVELEFGTESDVLTSWVASYLAEPEGDATELARGGSPADPDSNASAPPAIRAGSFQVPPAGDWIVTIAVRYAAGGDGFFAWHVTVD
jgi:hypothetical protein